MARNIIKSAALGLVILPVVIGYALRQGNAVFLALKNAWLIAPINFPLCSGFFEVVPRGLIVKAKLTSCGWQLSH